MQAFTIRAKNRASADALLAALSEFAPKLVGTETEGYSVTVPLRGSDGQIVSVLNAVEKHVRERQSAARVELDGRTYVVHPD